MTVFGQCKVNSRHYVVVWTLAYLFVCMLYCTRRNRYGYAVGRATMHTIWIIQLRLTWKKHFFPPEVELWRKITQLCDMPTMVNGETGEVFMIFDWKPKPIDNSAKIIEKKRSKFNGWRMTIQ